MDDDIVQFVESNIYSDTITISRMKEYINRKSKEDCTHLKKEELYEYLDNAVQEYIKKFSTAVLPYELNFLNDSSCEKEFKEFKESDYRVFYRSSRNTYEMSNIKLGNLNEYVSKYLNKLRNTHFRKYMLNKFNSVSCHVSEAKELLKLMKKHSIYFEK